jgi:Meiotic cell cortex C-terminal pleckstrin homology
MATAIAHGPESAFHNSHGPFSSAQSDPFLDDHADTPTAPIHRFSSFDSDSLSLASHASPRQLKRTLRAHLSETDRRLQDAQRLGTSLLQQQQELSERLREVETQEDEAEVSPELRKRLAEIGKEHDDIGREIAKALLAPKARAVSSEDYPATEGLETFSSHATPSPSKVSVPGRKQRNQPTSRAHDIQFATDISTSLLAQVRQLQAALSERDEALKSLTLEKAKLDHEAEGFSQRLRALNESEQRYKDENWNLETQTHELIATSKEAAEREKKLNAALAAALAEKSKAQNDLEELTVAHGQLGEEHIVAQKAHDSELHSLRRSVDAAGAERSSLQSRIEELTSQNQELAKAMATRLWNRDVEGHGTLLMEQEGHPRDISDNEHSPPPSPTKGTPRHGGLESETLKSSLHHAHRMIQNLKGNIHREKTEKIELKRMLQDARDELEQRRADGSGIGSGNKRQKMRADVFKKPVRPDMLGGSRRARTDVELEDQDWEDHVAGNSPSVAAASRNLAVGLGTSSSGRATDTSDAYQTANETEGAFETAHERDTTESEEFMTGAESLAGESTDELTETEDLGRGRGNTVRGSRGNRPSLAFKNAGDRSSFMSTASTSAGEEGDLKTPVQTQPPKYRLKVGRGATLQSAQTQSQSTPESSQFRNVMRDSPASFGVDQTPPVGEQSLFAELGGYNDVGADSQFGTPGRTSIISPKSTPTADPESSQSDMQPSQPTPLLKVATIDSGTMTEPWQPETAPVKPVGEAGVAAGAAVAGAEGAMAGLAPPEEELPQPSPSDFPLPPSMNNSPLRADMSTQYTPLKHQQEGPLRNLPIITPPKTIWDEAHDEERNNAGLADVPLSSHQQQTASLSFSNIVSHQTIPTTSQNSQLSSVVGTQPLSYSPIHNLETIPRAPVQEPSGNSPTVISADRDFVDSSTQCRDEAAAGTVGAGVIASVEAAIGPSQVGEHAGLVIAEDEASTGTGNVSLEHDPKSPPLQEISGNNGHEPSPSAGFEADTTKSISVSRSDQSSQTLLTSEQIDRALQKNVPGGESLTGTRESTPPPVLSQAVVAPPPPTILSKTTSRSRERASIGEMPSLRDPSSAKRPSSASSFQAIVASSSHPPLPPDHRTAIARAGGRLQSPVGEPQNASHLASLMGPPIAPASAYRRPRTPADQTISVGSPTRGGTTPRASHAGRHRPGSQLSRRSSVSSFASELDERFNIRTDGSGLPPNRPFEVGPGTDPRMIQAITQTMIGEFLWKYTRKPGRPEMSTSRHRRYFWVHPYTRTLYWSDQDPQSAGRSELKAKSVAIESVRVVSDDNPIPPGLHRKSLEVITPGRKVKFTAATGQRHETWFNALSYLLLRGQETAEAGNYAAGGHATAPNGGLTAEDVNEFNPSYLRPQQATNSSRLSMSSYNSRTTHGTSAPNIDSRQATRQSLPANVVPTTAQHASTTSRSTVRHNPTDRLSRSQEHDQALRQGSVSSRFSRMLGSVTSRSRTRASEPGPGMNVGGTDASNQDSIYNASVVSDGAHDSAEELRKELLKQEREADKLENVRACCDGKNSTSKLQNF